MIITIDGPVASGKSTVALALANRLSFYYVATGLLYRFVAYQLVCKERMSEADLIAVSPERVKNLFVPAVFEYRYTPLQGAQIMFKKEDYTPHLKHANVDKWASIVGAIPVVREEVAVFQRQLAAKHNLVVEGRDGGTVVFPGAELKIFLTASEDVRARRWQKDQMRYSNIFTFEESKKLVNARDSRDKNRPTSPLQKPADAIELDNSTMTLGETIDKIMDLAYKKD